MEIAEWYNPQFPSFLGHRLNTHAPNQQGWIKDKIKDSTCYKEIKKITSTVILILIHPFIPVYFDIMRCPAISTQ